MEIGLHSDCVKGLIENQRRRAKGDHDVNTGAPNESVRALEIHARKVQVAGAQLHKMIRMKFGRIDLAQLTVRKELDRKLQLPESDFNIFDSFAYRTARWRKKCEKVLRVSGL